MDYRNVISYNAYLLMSYQTYVNVEYYNKSNTIKYLFKYMVGREVTGYESIHGGHGFGVINVEGKTILDFSSTFDILITNTCFEKERRTSYNL
ncbi:hypothetical protein AHAS_Ahas07G0094700 [Arachis hypogaea]